jgi:hypothetical protein
MMKTTTRTSNLTANCRLKAITNALLTAGCGDYAMVNGSADACECSSPFHVTADYRGSDSNFTGYAPIKSMQGATSLSVQGYTGSTALVVFEPTATVCIAPIAPPAPRTFIGEQATMLSPEAAARIRELAANPNPPRKVASIPRGTDPRFLP